MTVEQGYALAADALLLIHTLVVLFISGGVIALVLGAIWRWPWLRNPWFRYLHLLAIGVVAAQAWLGMLCPLTHWEIALRDQAGEAVYAGSFVGHWLESLLYYRAPAWVFIALYTLVGGVTLASWRWLPPRPFNANTSDKEHT